MILIYDFRYHLPRRNATCCVEIGDALWHIQIYSTNFFLSKTARSRFIGFCYQARIIKPVFSDEYVEVSVAQ